jgi:transcriptional regulator with XRE-family HTH domain
MEKGNKPIKGGKEPMQSALTNDPYVKELDPEKYHPSGFPKKMDRKKYGLTVSERLKIARKRKNLSLQQVANELEKIDNLGIKATRSNIQGYEAEEDKVNHRYPSLYVFYNLCKIYDVNVDYILGFSDEMERPSENLIDHLDNSTNIMIDGEKMIKEEIEMLKVLAREMVNRRKSLS